MSVGQKRFPREARRWGARGKIAKNAVLMAFSPSQTQMGRGGPLRRPHRRGCADSFNGFVGFVGFHGFHGFAGGGGVGERINESAVSVWIAPRFPPTMGSSPWFSPADLSSSDFFPPRTWKPN